MPFRIYTKTGDAGETALFGGRRVLKSDLRVDSYGTVDELNASIGLLRDWMPDDHCREILYVIQHRLFSLGGHLASDPEKQLPPIGVSIQDVELLEQEIDRMEDSLPALQNFILPGGHQAVSQAHVCRTVCRRAERLIVALRQADKVDELALQYLNRLSDYFFVLARYTGQLLNVPEIIWKNK